MAAKKMKPAVVEWPPVPGPFLKWAGGKTAIAPVLLDLLPADLAARTYREPFVGGGGMFFYVQHHRRPRRVVLSDILPGLVLAYQVVQAQPDALIARLEELRATHSPEQFYRVRGGYNIYRNSNFSVAPVERAAHFIYLNKTCFNGLHRSNLKGKFNTPVGSYKNPGVVDPAALRLASQALQDVPVRCEGFDHLRAEAKAGDVIYLDPPYVPESATANFASYAMGGFGPKEQRGLADLYRELDDRGCLLALSNSNTQEVRDLYRGFDVTEVVAPRNISSKATTRGDTVELLIRNTRRWPA